MSFEKIAYSVIMFTCVLFLSSEVLPVLNKSYCAEPNDEESKNTVISHDSIPLGLYSHTDKDIAPFIHSMMRDLYIHIDNFEYSNKTVTWLKDIKWAPDHSYDLEYKVVVKCNQPSHNSNNCSSINDHLFLDLNSKETKLVEWIKSQVKKHNTRERRNNF